MEVFPLSADQSTNTGQRESRSNFHSNDGDHHQHFIEAFHHHPHIHHNLPTIYITRDIYYNIKTDWSYVLVTYADLKAVADNLAAEGLKILTSKRSLTKHSAKINE